MIRDRVLEGSEPVRPLSLGSRPRLLFEAMDADVERLLGGWQAAMAFTDPPYNVDLGRHGGQQRTARRRLIANDALDPESWEAYYFGDSATAAFVSTQVQTLNVVLESVYAAHGVRVADVAGAFHVGDGLELEATAALSWTWFCSADHFGDVHPNDVGYHIIEQAFEAAP